MAARFRVEITATGERDIAAIADHIASDNPRAAERWERALVAQARQLARFPARGAVIPEAQKLGVEYRHLLHGVYRTIYRIQQDRVIVVRIIHGARLLLL